MKEIYVDVSVLKDYIPLNNIIGHSAISGEDREKDTPVHIPNTAVKLLIAEGSALATMCENRTLPDSTKRHTILYAFFYAFLRCVLLLF